MRELLPRPVSVYVVEAPAVCYLLADRLIRAHGFDLAGAAVTMAAALPEIPTLAPHIAVLASRLPDGDGLDLCQLLLDRAPAVRSIIHAPTASSEFAIRAGRAGAWAVVPQRIDLGPLVDAIAATAVAPAR